MKSIQFSLEKVNVIMKLVKEKKLWKGWMRNEKNYESESLKV